MMDRIALAYLKGVLDGDGWIDWFINNPRNPRLCLRVKSQHFAFEFMDALKIIELKPRLNEEVQRHKHKNHPRFQKYDFTTHFFVVRATAKPDIIKHIQGFKPLTKAEKASYLKGLYDSDGCYVATPRTHKLELCNSNRILLWISKGYLAELGVKSHIYDLNPKLAARLCTFDNQSIKNFMQLVGALGGRYVEVRERG